MDNQILVDAFNGHSHVDRPDLRRLFIKIGRLWEHLLVRLTTSSRLLFEFGDGSPLRWTKRCFNSQADHLCHISLSRRDRWEEVPILAGNVRIEDGDLLAGWCDGGFHQTEGGTAGFIILLLRANTWSVLRYGGTYDNSQSYDSFRMEASGLEMLLQSYLQYI